MNWARSRRARTCRLVGGQSSQVQTFRDKKPQAGRFIPARRVDRDDAGSVRSAPMAFQTKRPPRMRRPFAKSGKSGSELGRQVAVDLEPDADLDECRCGPSHGLLPSGRVRPLQPTSELTLFPDQGAMPPPQTGTSQTVVPVSNARRKQNRLIE